MARQLVRLVPHGSSGKATTQSGKYNATPGSFVDIFNDTTDLTLLTANGWHALGMVGTTANRPDPYSNNLKGGMPYIDTSLAAVIIWDGLNWRSPLTGSIV